jgi:hypothetical protein
VANRTKEGVGTYLYPHIYYRWRSQNIVYIQPQLDMSVGEFKLAQIQLGRIYLMELRYIQSMVGDTVLKPDETRINSVGQIYPTWVVCQASKTRRGPDISDWSDMSDLGWLSSLWNPIKMSDLVGYIRPSRHN